MYIINILDYIEMIKYYLNKKSLQGICWFERKKMCVIFIYNVKLK